MTFYLNVTLEPLILDHAQSVPVTLLELAVELNSAYLNKDVHNQSAAWLQDFLNAGTSRDDRWQIFYLLKKDRLLRFHSHLYR